MSYLVWLGHFLTAANAADIKKAQQQVRKHPLFLYPYTALGARGLQVLYTLEEQAFCQNLAHAGCIPSSLLLGLSLSHEYRDSRRVICEVNAYQYAFCGIEAMLNHCGETGFSEEWSLFLESPVLFQVCHFLCRKWALLETSHQYHPVIQFCTALTQGCESFVHFDS